MIIAVGKDQIAATIQADLAGILEDLRKRGPLFELAHNVNPRFCLTGILESDQARLKQKFAT